MINNEVLSKKGNRVWRTTTAPAIEPVTLTELKLFARIDHSHEDTLLTSLISTARILAEKYTNRAFIEQSITLSMDWVDWEIDLPRPPFISITSFKILYEDGTFDSITSSSYYTHLGELESKIVIYEDVGLPVSSDRGKGGYEIIYKAGYGDEASDVPNGIKEGIKLIATEIYEGRATLTEVPEKAKALLLPYRIPVL